MEGGGAAGWLELFSTYSDGALTGKPPLTSYWGTETERVLSTGKTTQNLRNIIVSVG